MKKILIVNFMIFNIGFAALSYEDLNKEHWAYSSIENLVKKGIIKENSYKFNGEDSVSRYEFAYDLSKVLDKVDLEKANKEDLNILEALILEFSKELNKIGFDTETYNSKIDNINETVELLKKRVNENEIVIDQLKKRIEKLENKK
ncbi:MULTISPECIES: S-layer homology domain-containing protein [Fusobacterium]|uniref:S-layer homology domain-containing protein n=1 Tax=Fusobacterium TaxID=848 RepID=UPI001E557266|nr:S-layer homology domain-containing protein [Fusobacterium ulcerans]